MKQTEREIHGIVPTAFSDRSNPVECVEMLWLCLLPMKCFICTCYYLITCILEESPAICWHTVPCTGVVNPLKFVHDRPRRRGRRACLLHLRVIFKNGKVLGFLVVCTLDTSTCYWLHFAGLFFLYNTSIYYILKVAHKKGHSLVTRPLYIVSPCLLFVLLQLQM